MNWEMVAFALAVIIVFWIAVWILDFTYYNRLLLGAADALFALEKESKEKLRVRSIDMSTTILRAVNSDPTWEAGNWKLTRGRWLFYSLVVLALVAAFVFAIIQVAVV
jgi:hypothetical protein